MKNYRIDPENGIVYGLRGKPIKRRNHQGYIHIYNGHVGNQSKNFACLAHRMIWESVHGSIPEGLQINHINGVKSDNRIANLELVTASENLKHAYRLGLASARGEQNGRAILTLIAVRDIRRSSESSRTLAQRYGVSPITIRDVRSGKKWSHCA